MSSWKGLYKRRAELEAAGATLVGVSADTPETLRRFRSDLSLPFTMLSDPQLICGQELDSPVSTRKGYWGALALHPEIREYPRKAFLQPALFVWKRGELVFEWRQTESVLNLFGAKGRPKGAQALEIVRDALGV